MGQYHSIHNLDRNTYYSPRDLGAGVKLMEQGLSFGSCTALLGMAAGPWKGKRLAIIGDYYEDGDLPADSVPTDPTDTAQTVRHSLAARGLLSLRSKTTTMGNYTHTFTEALPGKRIADPADRDPYVLINLDKRERLNPTDLGDPADAAGVYDTGWVGGTGTALTVLLGVSNKGGARGGGDIFSDDPLVGSWGGDRIAFVPAADKLASGDWQDIGPRVREVFTTAEGFTFDVSEDGAVKRSR